MAVQDMKNILIPLMILANSPIAIPDPCIPIKESTYISRIIIEGCNIKLGWFGGNGILTNSRIKKLRVALS
jgi:hypothetical protein